MVDKTELNKAMQDATREFQKENPGQTLNQKQLDAMRSSIEKNLASNEAIRNTTMGATSTTFTVLNAGAVAMDGTAMYGAGAKGNIPGQLRTYGYDLQASASQIKASVQQMGSEGIITGAGRTAALATVKSGGALVGRLSIPLTIGLGVYETYQNVRDGNRKGAYEASTGTALSLGAAVAAGAAVGTLVTPLVGTVVGAVVGVAGYYGGRWLGGTIADATDPKKDFKAAAQPAPSAPSKMSVSFDPGMFKNAPATQGAFASAVKPAGVDVTKVAESNTNATNDPQFKKTAQIFTYG